MEGMVKLTGLWKSTDKKGDTYLSGTLNAVSKVLVMPNTFKAEGDTGPDYFLYVTPNQEKKDRPAKHGGGSKGL